MGQVTAEADVLASRVCIFVVDGLGRISVGADYYLSHRRRKSCFHDIDTQHLVGQLNDFWPVSRGRRAIPLK